MNALTITARAYALYFKGVLYITDMCSSQYNIMTYERLSYACVMCII